PPPRHLPSFPPRRSSDLPSTGNVKLRLVNASPAAGSVDIYVTAPAASLATSTPSLTNVPFKTASSYLTMLAGSYEIRVTTTGSKDRKSTRLNSSHVKISY